ncbi:uncharacterized protein ACRADG_002773 [Cochliomyia hominivorax]
MNCKLILALCAVLCIVSSLEAASLRGAEQKSQTVVHKLDYETVEANLRSARQAYLQDSGEDSDEDDEEDDAELQHQNAIRRQQAYEQSIGDSQEGSDEDDDETGDNDEEDFYGRRLRRDVSEAETHNDIQETPKPTETTENKEKQPATEAQTSPATASNPSASGSSNTSVLILIRDAIKKVTEFPNTQQVATSAQQYFQLFEHFLQQTIEQVIGDDDDDEETESTTILPDSEKETESENSDKVTETNDKPHENESADKQSVNAKPEKAQTESKPVETNEIKA